MSDAFEIYKSDFELTDRFTDRFIERYGLGVIQFVLNNKEDIEMARKTLHRVFLEVYYRIKYDGFDIDQDNTALINTLAFKVLADLCKTETKSAALKVDAEMLIPEQCELFVNSENFNREKIEEVLKKIGEPGRTALKLSFFDKTHSDEVAGSIQADSTDEMDKKRMRFLDKCVGLLK